MEENFAGGKFREIPFGVDIIFAGGKFRAKSKFAKIAKIYSTRKIGVIQYVKQEKMLEAVQRRATRLVSTIRKKEYPERFEKLKLPSLAYRRRRGDMIEVYKYTHNIYNVAVQPVEVEIRTTRRHNYKLLKTSSSTSQRQKFFSMRVVNAWNSLPELVVTHAGHHQ